MNKICEILLKFSHNINTCDKTTQRLKIEFKKCSLQNFNHDYDLAGHTTNGVCFNLMSGRIYSLKSTPND